MMICPECNVPLIAPGEFVVPLGYGTDAILWLRVAICPDCDFVTIIEYERRTQEREVCEICGQIFDRDVDLLAHQFNSDCEREINKAQS